MNSNAVTSCVNKTCRTSGRVKYWRFPGSPAVSMAWAWPCQSTFSFVARRARAAVGARVTGQVSTPLAWDEVATVDPDSLTLATVAGRLAERGDPWAGINDDPQVLDPLLEMSDRDMAAGLMDAPWPPVYPKQPNEPPRVAPSRARKVDTDEPPDGPRTGPAT